MEQENEKNKELENKKSREWESKMERENNIADTNNALYKEIDLLLEGRRKWMKNHQE